MNVETARAAVESANGYYAKCRTISDFKIRDGRALRWEPIAFILEGFERVGSETAPEW